MTLEVCEHGFHSSLDIVDPSCLTRSAMKKIKVIVGLQALHDVLVLHWNHSPMDVLRSSCHCSIVVNAVQTREVV